MPSISNMPPVMPQPAPGTQTCDRYGNVISTRPTPAPEAPPAAPAAPTCDRYGEIISAPAGWTSNPAHVPIPGTNFVPNENGSIDWK